MARSARRDAIMRQLTRDIQSMDSGLSGNIFTDDAREVAIEIEHLIECVIDEKLAAAIDSRTEKG